MPRLNPLLVVAAVLFGAGALPLLFAPDELLRLAGAVPSPLTAGLLQVLGCALVGFALLDWMARYTRIDGIFGRPLVIANLGHTASAALLLARLAARVHGSPFVFAAVGAYGLLALAFGSRLFAGSASLEAQREGS
jgi:hypothetical protein